MTIRMFDYVDGTNYCSQFRWKRPSKRIPAVWLAANRLRTVRKEQGLG